MRPELQAVLRTGEGLFTREQLLGVTDHNVLDHAVSRGSIVRLLPRVYSTPALAQDARIRLRAALAFAGPDAALSHLSAARIWRIRVPDSEHVHVLIPRTADHRTNRFVVIHRHASAELPRHLLAYSSGLPAVRPAPTLVDCWAMLDRGHRRDLVITAVRDGRVSSEEIRALADDRPLLRGRRELIELADQLRAGAHSELEIFGLRRVFEHPSLPRPRRQFLVVVDGSRYVLDLAWPELKLGVELDGAAYHGSTAQRERDVRRDAALATVGWQVIRVTYARITSDPIAVRHDLATIVAARRTQITA
ncbi:MAG: DUF559 domain-containing protein [Actinomycetota bacterium]|nr:DUF559 domain-containing protein [Actinomycetota bacterium]